MDDEKVDKREMEEATDRANNKGVIKTMLVQTGQKMGVVERTKLEPSFEQKIAKLVEYHNIVYEIVERLEAQIQYDPEVLATRKLKCEPGRNPWEMIGGWMHYLSTKQFEGHEAKILKKYSSMCGKIGKKETEAQGNTRTHWTKKMRSYSGAESEELNENIDLVKRLLLNIDETRHQLKNSSTNKMARVRGEVYSSMIREFNSKAGDVQAMIDEMTIAIRLHQNEFLRFCKEFGTLNDTIYNCLMETRLRLSAPPLKK